MTEFASEADLETGIAMVQREMFGPNRIYLDVKKLIGVKGIQQNIPDGYLIDLSGKKPKLYVVENERANHSVLRHIAIQILEFSLAFESEPRRVRSILINALAAQPEKRNACESYAATHNFRNLDHLLDELVHSDFQAVVVIDRIPENLINVLSRKFAFGVEVLELRRFENELGEHKYLFEPFLQGISEDSEAGPGELSGAPVHLDTSELDTVVVPAREDGFQETFIGENRWYQVRIHGTMRPQIKHIAVYRRAPISAITHVAPVSSIEPWGDSGKFVLNFAEPARTVGPIPLVPKGRVKALQNLRYTTLSRLEAAKSLDDVWWTGGKDENEG